MVADFCGGIGGAGDFPAAEVLGADGEAEEVGCVGIYTVEVGGHFLGVVQFVGDLCITGGYYVGVVLVRLVDAREGEVEFGHCGGLRGWAVDK